MSVWYVLSEVNRKVQVSELYQSLLVFDSCNVQLEPKHVTVPSHQTYITDIIMMLNGFLDSTAVNHKQSEIQIHPGRVIHNRTSHSIGDREILIDVKTVDYFRSPPCGPWKSQYHFLGCSSSSLPGTHTAGNCGFDGRTF